VKETGRALDLLKRCLSLNPSHQEALQLFHQLRQLSDDSDDSEVTRESDKLPANQDAPPSASYWLRSDRIRQQRWNETARN